MPSPKAPSARVLANRKTRIMWNKAAVDALQMGLADGLIALGEQVIADASKGPGGSGVGSLRDPKTAAERGVPMMLETGTLSVWALGKLVHGGTEKAASRYKPKVKVGTKTDESGATRYIYRAVATPKDQAVLFVGFASPLSHFAELGTIKEPARPFLQPAFNHHIKDAARFCIPAMGKRVRAVR